MTIAVLPAVAPRTGDDDLSLWPASTVRLPHGGLAVGGVSLAELAERFDTPAYVLDEGEVRARCRTYRDAFPGAEVLYAAKAFLSRAMVRWVREEGLGLDVCSAGELELAMTAGFPPERIVLHGNAKSPRDITTALRLGVGRIVIDSPSEIARIAAAVGPDGHQKVMVRVVPGVSAGGHDKIRTGTDDQKFGLSPTDGNAQRAVARILGLPQLELTGLHCHIGSQITAVEPYLVALRRLVELTARVRDEHGVVLPELGMSGGHGIAYRPGEAGDILASGVDLPGDVRPGDLLAVPVAGAYQLSMASGYNMVGRPPVIAVHEGSARVLVRRETPADLRSRDIGG
ncbi:diaminopimelate decarboxylase family protein [Streptomyces sp. NPDC058646]|uniref:diaminopimelate decarboxylase family protein n=1 Tax=Streptomyces sp. NPDC058646 TaxID=3346574 RepID=UPI003657BC17